MGPDGRGRRAGQRWIYPAGAVAARAGGYQLQRACAERAVSGGARSPSPAFCADKRIQRSAPKWHSLPGERDAAVALCDWRGLARTAGWIARAAALWLG